MTGIRKFVDWYGPSAAIANLEPWKVSEYAETFDAASTNVAARLEPVRDFLRYARKKNWTTDNLANHIKVRGGRRKGASGARREEHRRIELTADGLERLRMEHEALRRAQPRLAEAIRVAAADKDFRENQPYHAAREEKARVDSRIREIEAILARAEVMEHGDASNDRVRLGVTVRLHDLHDDVEVRWTIVNPSEVNARAGKISVESPIGRALLDHRVGDDVEVLVPAGIQRYRILEIVS